MAWNGLFYYWRLGIELFSIPGIYELYDYLKLNRRNLNPWMDVDLHAFLARYPLN